VILRRGEKQSAGDSKGEFLKTVFLGRQSLFKTLCLCEAGGGKRGGGQEGLNRKTRTRRERSERGTRGEKKKKQKSTGTAPGEAGIGGLPGIRSVSESKRHVKKGTILEEKKGNVFLG